MLELRVFLFFKAKHQMIFREEDIIDVHGGQQM